MKTNTLLIWYWNNYRNKSSNNFSPVKQKPKRVPRIKNESKQSVEKGAGSRTSERGLWFFYIAL